MSNYEKKKSMSINEFADFFCDKLHTACRSCKFYLDCYQNMNMGIGIKQWLEAEEATE